jgi:hypothetical protein
VKPQREAVWLGGSTPRERFVAPPESSSTPRERSVAPLRRRCGWLVALRACMCVLIREGGEDAVAAELANEELEAATNPQPKRTLTFFGWH